MEVLDEAFKGIQGTLDHRGGGPLGGGFPPPSRLRVWGSPPSRLLLSVAASRPPSPQPRRPLPFPPRKGKRKGKPKSVGGVGRKTRLLPEVWLEAWFSENSVLTADFLPLGLWGRFDAVS